MDKTAAELIEIVLASFEAEKAGDIQAGKNLIDDDFKKVSMVVSGDKIFPTLSGDEVDAALQRAYQVKGREFHVWNTAANVKTQTVFIELAEVEPGKDEHDRIWPYVLVCQIKDGKIWRSRHYGDPATLKRNLSVEQIEKIVAG